MTDPLFDLTGRVAVVTGGLGQLGAAYTEGLAERGMRVAVFDAAAEPGADGDSFAATASTSRTARRSRRRRRRWSTSGACRTCS